MESIILFDFNFILPEIQTGTFIMINIIISIYALIVARKSTVTEHFVFLFQLAYQLLFKTLNTDYVVICAIFPPFILIFFPKYNYCLPYAQQNIF